MFVEINFKTFSNGINNNIDFIQKLISLTLHLIIQNSRPAPSTKNTGRKLKKPNVSCPGQRRIILRSVVETNIEARLEEILFLVEIFLEYK